MQVIAVTGVDVAAQTGTHTAGHDALHRDLAVKISGAAELVQDLEHVIRSAAIDLGVLGQLLGAQNIGNESFDSVRTVIGGTVQGQPKLFEILIRAMG